jgi:Tfp pilus assembly protein PilX
MPLLLNLDLARKEPVNRIPRAKSNRRLGLILAAVLLSLLVVTLVGAELTEAIAQHHRQSRLAEDRQQAFWIAESAVQRAVHALAKSPDYQGETWRLSAEDLGSGRAGVATIKVGPAAGSTTQRRIAVQAYFPDDPVYRTLYERELILD